MLKSKSCTGTCGLPRAWNPRSAPPRLGALRQRFRGFRFFLRPVRRDGEVQRALEAGGKWRDENF